MVIQNQRTYLKKIVLGCLATLLGVATVGLAALPAFAASGFDQYGYNRGARIFNGTGGSWAEARGALASSMAPYDKDKLVMKWNAAWDACNAAGSVSASACQGATLTNEWNGNVPGGSGDTEHFKTVWITSGSCGADYTVLPDGGYCIWGHYEAIMDHSISGGVHEVWAKANPSGFGAYK